jgi:DNA (cytosine-5)-methyltransferase 1
VTRPRLLDLFCGAGGAAVGYHRGGFDVVGVDIRKQPNYPFRFEWDDALEYVAEHAHEYDAIHASPPCQGYSVANNIHRRDDHPLLIAQVRNALIASGLPYVIENVEGAKKDMCSPVTICGLSVGCNVRRHRLFECSFPVMVPPCGDHSGDWLIVFGGTPRRRGKKVGVAKGGGSMIRRPLATANEAREAMGIDWMTRDELSEAIPPAMTEHIGHYLMAAVTVREAA